MTSPLEKQKAPKQKSAREKILGALKRNQNIKPGSEKNRLSAVEERINHHKANTIPQRGKQSLDEHKALLTTLLEGQGATILNAENSDAVPELVADYLRKHNLPAEFKMGQDLFLADLPWDKAPTLSRRLGPSDGTDQVALSMSFGAAAESGTLVLVSGPGNPTTLNFLPEHHIILLKQSDLYGNYEEVWDKIRSFYGAQNMPRAVNFISGPSRTADIEQTLVRGAHGPKELCLIIVKD